MQVAALRQCAYPRREAACTITDGARKGGHEWEHNDALSISLLEWINLLENEKPRILSRPTVEDIEVIIYTDGYFPDRRKGEAEEPRIGGVAFVKDREFPVAFSQEGAQEVMGLWIAGRRRS